MTSNFKRDDNDYTFRVNVIKYIYLSFGILIFLALAIRHSITPVKPVVLITVIAGASIIIFGYWMTLKNKNLILIGRMQLFSLFAIGIASGINNGGIYAPATVVFTILPIIGSLYGGIKEASLGLILSTLGIISINVVDYFKLVHPINNPQ